MYSGIAAIISVQFVIYSIIIIKYWGDIRQHFRGEGEVPYPGQPKLRLNPEYEK